jgi:hypothetical protein
MWLEGHVVATHPRTRTGPQLNQSQQVATQQSHEQPPPPPLQHDDDDDDDNCEEQQQGQQSLSQHDQSQQHRTQWLVRDSIQVYIA